jgi:hypothetical protein
MGECFPILVFARFISPVKTWKEKGSIHQGIQRVGWEAVNEVDQIRHEHKVLGPLVSARFG